MLDEIPVTFMRYFYMGSRLRWLVSTTNWPQWPVYKDWMLAFRAAFKDATKGTRYTDILSFLASVDSDAYEYCERLQTVIPRPVYEKLLSIVSRAAGDTSFRSAYAGTAEGQALLPTSAHFVDRITLGNVKFSTHRSLTRNSFVLFAVPGGSAPMAGCIDKIFYHRRRENNERIVEPFVVVREYVPLSEGHRKHDPFSAFPDLDAKLYYNEFTAAPRVIRLADITSHFAALTYTPAGVGRPCIIVKGLDRVRCRSFLHRARL